jgi:hypothetical protein
VRTNSSPDPAAMTKGTIKVLQKNSRSRSNKWMIDLRCINLQEIRSSRIWPLNGSHKTFKTVVEPNSPLRVTATPSNMDSIALSYAMNESVRTVGLTVLVACGGDGNRFSRLVPIKEERLMVFVRIDRQIEQGGC